jgi:predicted acylesterase/phospholipase RssA
MRALVCSGGGARGAYQAGVIYHLLHERGIRYDIITGTSVGALNGSFLSMHKAGEEAEAATALRELWHGIEPAKVHRLWYRGILGKIPAAWKLSVFNTAPLQKLVLSTLDLERVKTSGKLLRVGAVSLHSGERRVWTEQDPEIALAVLASSAFPVFYPPIEIGGELFTDDGVRENTPCEEAIKAGATHLDIVQCGIPGAGGTLKKKNAINVAARCLSAQSDENAIWDIRAIDLYTALIRAGTDVPGKRIITTNRIWPSRGLGLENSLDFTNEKARVNWLHGLADAQGKSWDIPR